MSKINNYLGRDFKKNRKKDKLSKQERSVLMSNIRSKNTKFERIFISNLKKKQKRKFKTHNKKIQGTPDIVFEKEKTLIFLDSNFWHGWYYPRWKHLLKNDFWRIKIEKNRKRDIRNSRYLRKSGWKVIRIWEHEIKNNPNKAIAKVEKALE